MKDLKGDELLWGDEIEYGVFRLDPDNKKIRLSLRAKDVSACDFCLYAPHLRVSWGISFSIRFNLTRILAPYYD